MTKEQFSLWACRLQALSVFRNVLQTPPIQALLSYLTCKGERSEALAEYGRFVYSLAEDGNSFSEFLRRALREDENRYVVAAARNEDLPPSLVANAEEELALFSRLTTLTPDDFKPDGYTEYFPRFEVSPVNFSEEYAERLAHIRRYGYGIFASARMFRVEDSQIVPVPSADNISLDRFVGYAEERRRVFENTQALIDGKPSANVLLFGDAGTGKSSTVKACVNHFYDQGLRLIELRKDQLFSLSHVMGRIADNPLKFIIFIDDLSFNKNDDCFSMLKAALEGSASAKTNNAVIYATSNRRHIVKENFSDREKTDDIHHSDTVQELMSLSDRFGLTVYFERPNKALYLDIVHNLAEKYGVSLERSQLDVKAEAFALSKGSRSPRAAEQFINSLLQKGQQL